MFLFPLFYVIRVSQVLTPKQASSQQWFHESESKYAPVPGRGYAPAKIFGGAKLVSVHPLQRKSRFHSGRDYLLSSNALRKDYWDHSLNLGVKKYHWLNQALSATSTSKLLPRLGVPRADLLEARLPRRSNSWQPQSMKIEH